MIIAARLAKAGYGTIEQILQMDVSLVIVAIHYESFISEYEEEFINLNKETA